MRPSFVNRNGLLIATGALVALALVSVGGGLLLDAEIETVLVNLGIEFFGITITVWIINSLVGTHDQLQLKEQLARQMASKDNELALRAVAELREREWITDGSLQRVELFLANLEGAQLAGAHLRKADMVQTNLQGAELVKANLQGANLFLANLTGANLAGAYLQNANMFLTCLHGADLAGANMQDADLAGAKFDETTILRDGKMWTPDTDMARFTDPNHPEYWHPKDPVQAGS